MNSILFIPFAGFVCDHPEMVYFSLKKGNIKLHISLGSAAKQ